MKKNFLFLILWSICLHNYFTSALAIEDDECIDYLNRVISREIHTQPNHVLESALDLDIKSHNKGWNKHLNYTLGAFGGAVIGSFFVNIFDTIATRKFALGHQTSWQATTKSIFKSYLPVLGGVVPMRALSFGVYSICQDGLEDYVSFSLNKVLSAALSGTSLAILTTPAEVMKTRKQIDSKISGFVIKDLTGSFIPLATRIVPTVTCMLAGTEAIETILPIDNIFFSTLIASLTASSLSQIIGTPAENIRTYRIKEMDYQTSTINLIKIIKFRKIYAGFWHRAFALGTQATFTLVAAKIAS